MTGRDRRSRDGRDVVKAGFLPLVDAAPLVVASRLGFAREEGLAIELLRETSWATLRDRLAVRHLDVAHMLSPMPVADSLDLTPLSIGLVVPMALGFGGNTITLAPAVFDALVAHGYEGNGDAVTSAKAMAGVVAERRRRDAAPAVLAIVHPYSAHHYQLAYWLGWAGLCPGRDVELVVVPPPLMASALGSGQIHGFCAGEPWGSAAAAEGGGRIVTTGARIWRRIAEKVLGVRRTFAMEDPERLSRLVRCIYRAALWCDDVANRDALAGLLAEPDIVGQPADVIRAGLDRRQDPGTAKRDGGAGFLTFAADEATFPSTAHAAWLYAQMVRWGQVHLSDGGLRAARATYRPDLYRAALSPCVPVPGEDDFLGQDASQLAFDAVRFEPAHLADYIASFAVRGVRL